MDETITTARNGWYLLEATRRDGEPVGVRRTPIVAWRIGAGGALPVPLGGGAVPADSAETAVMHPNGTVWFENTEHAGVRAFIDFLRRRAGGKRAARSPDAAPAAESSAGAPPAARLLDPELAEEDRTHAMVELLNVHNEEFVLHAHEWQKALALARAGGWSALGTRHGAVAGWEGRYDEPHNQRVRTDDARAFADALERALPLLPPQREADFVQHSDDETLLALSPADYLGGVKGRPFVEALVRFARGGEFRIT